MSPRKVKVYFRRRQSSRMGTMKAYTTVRIPHQRHPKQLHLGYLPKGKCIRECDKKKIESALRKHWRTIFHHEDVSIDWKDAEKRWRKRKRTKRSQVDRSNANAQIKTWLSEEDDVITAPFGGPCKGTGKMSREQFWAAYLRLPLLVAEQLKNVDTTGISEWWETREAPRLLYCYQRYAKRHKRDFSRDGFLEYLFGNVKMGFAQVQYLRECQGAITLPHTIDWQWLSNIPRKT